MTLIRALTDLSEHAAAPAAPTAREQLRTLEALAREELVVLQRAASPAPALPAAPGPDPWTSLAWDLGLEAPPPRGERTPG